MSHPASEMRVRPCCAPPSLLLLLCLAGAWGEEGGDLSQQFYVSEEQPLGSVVATVGLPDAPPPYSPPFYQSAGAAAVLSFSEQGVLTLKGRMDREVRSLYRLLIKSRSAGRDIAVTIHVLDVNDNSPTFPSGVISARFLESTPLDVKYPLGSALDPDLGLNSTQRYEIVSGNTDAAFRLGSKRAPNGVLYLDLVVSGVLDHETTPEYHLVVAAYDGGRPRLAGTLRVDIIIVDANDNQPTFNQSRYFARVREDAAVGHSVLQVCHAAG